MSDNTKVICPNCVHEFTAIPVNVQDELAEARTRIAELEKELLHWKAGGSQGQIAKWREDSEQLSRERELRQAAQAELLRVQELSLRECGIGFVDARVISAILASQKENKA